MTITIAHNNVIQVKDHQCPFLGLACFYCEFSERKTWISWQSLNISASFSAVNFPSGHFWHKMSSNLHSSSIIVFSVWDGTASTPRDVALVKVLKPSFEVFEARESRQKSGRQLHPSQMSQSIWFGRIKGPSPSLTSQCDSQAALSSHQRHASLQVWKRLSCTEANCQAHGSEACGHHMLVLIKMALTHSRLLDNLNEWHMPWISGRHPKLGNSKNGNSVFSYRK